MQTRIGCGVAALVLVACGGSVERSASGVGGAGGGGAGGSGATTSGGSGGGTGAVAGSGGSVSCAQTWDGVSVSVQPDWGDAPACPSSGSEYEPVIWEGQGEVVKSEGNVFVLDTCPPNADCMASFVTVTVDAEGLSLSIPSGAFVKVRYELLPAWMFCNERISIVNVPSWGGLSNPVSSGQELYLAATEGLTEAPPAAPFSVSSEPLGCFPGAPGYGAGPPENHALVFDAGGASASVYMGQTATLAAGGQTLLVRNQRSFVSGNFDDYWNWSWWATGVPFDAM